MNEKKTDVAKKDDSQALELILKKEGVMEVALSRIETLMASNSLHVPKDYSPQNAVRSAWLLIQEVKGRGDVPALTACTQVSIMYAILDMVTQGLSAVKEQCYFIVFGNKLVCLRSYHGNIYLAKRADPAIDRVNAKAVHEGDEFTFEMADGIDIITKHKQTLESMGDKEIVAAYCTILDKDGKVRYGDIMPIDRIKRSWGMSKMNVVDSNGKIKAGSVHDKFTDEMAVRTIINHACKRIINSSGDAHLVDAMKANEQVVAHAFSNEKALQEENGKVIDIEQGGEPPAEPVDAPADGKGPEF